MQSVGKLQQTFPLSHRATAETQDSARSQIPVALLLTPVTLLPISPCCLALTPAHSGSLCCACGRSRERKPSVKDADSDERSTSDRSIDRSSHAPRKKPDRHTRPTRELAPCPLPPAPCPIPSRTCAKVICCDHLEQSISSAQLSSAQHSSLAVAQRNFVSSL